MIATTSLTVTLCWCGIATPDVCGHVLEESGQYGGI